MTAKYVLTGGPCSGKTTVISELQSRGYQVLEEIAREIIQQRQHIPFTPEENLARQRIIINAQIDRENSLNGIESFLDRGFIDCLAYQRHFFGKTFPEFLASKKTPKYDAVFVLDRLPFKNDGLRIESGDEEAEKIHNEIISQYRLHGYTPIFVPVMPVGERVDFVLKCAGGLKNGLH